LLHEVEKDCQKKTKILNRKFSDICRKEVDNIWTVSRYCDDTGKSDEQIVKVKKQKTEILKLLNKIIHFKEVLDYCVYANVEPERERLIGHSIQTWRMFHRQETKAGFWFVFKRIDFYLIKKNILFF